MLLLKCRAGICDAVFRIAWPLPWLALQTHCRWTGGARCSHFLEKYVFNTSTMKGMQMLLFSECKISHLFEELDQSPRYAPLL